MAEPPSLIPGLPEEIAVTQILPRLPWYARPVCRSLSTLWKLNIDAHHPSLDLTTRNFQLPQLIGSVLITAKRFVFIRDRYSGEWRRLPPIPNLPEGTVRFQAWAGMIYVWTLAPGKCWSPNRDFIFKLDIGRGKWIWEKFPAAHLSNWFDDIRFGGKIYARWNSRIRTYGFGSVRLDVTVYDMETDVCSEDIGKWEDCTAVSVLPGLNDELSEEMYSFRTFWGGDRVCHFNLLRYGSCCREWKLAAELPVLENHNGSQKFGMVSGECFEPARGRDSINVVMERYKKKPLWCGFTARDEEREWIEIEVEALPGRRQRGVDGYKMFFKDGSVYAMSGDDQTVWKGKIKVESRTLVWKEVFVIPKGKGIMPQKFSNFNFM